MSDDKTIEFATRGNPLEFAVNESCGGMFVTVEGREADSTALMTMEQARELHKWLSERIKELEL